MLGLRLEGDPREAAELLHWLTSMGIEVATGTVKARREGFSHTYATIRLGDATTAQEPIRVASTIARPALPTGRGRTSTSGRRPR